MARTAIAGEITIASKIAGKTGHKHDRRPRMTALRGVTDLRSELWGGDSCPGGDLRKAVGKSLFPNFPSRAGANHESCRSCSGDSRIQKKGINQFETKPPLPTGLKLSERWHDIGVNGKT